MEERWSRGRVGGDDPATDPAVVTCLPPEKADDAGATHLNLYLYLAAHDAEGGPNLPMSSGGANPISTVPLPLKLYYVLTAHGADHQDNEDVAGQHSLIGLAMKTLHDHAIIKDGYMIGGAPVFAPGKSLNGGRIEVALRPITPEESVSFWSTDQVRTARLAAYYEVRTVLLEPEQESSAGLPVTDVSLGVFAGGPPRLFSSRSTQSFTRANAVGGGTISVERAPAVAMLNAPSEAQRVVEIAGMALGDGSDAALVLRGGNLPNEGLILEAGANPSWGIVVADQSLRFTVQPTAQPRSGAPVALLPGLYTAALMRARTLSNSDRSVQSNMEVESNRLPFAISPTIASAGVLGSGNLRVVTAGGYNVDDAAALAEFSAGTTRCNRTTVSAAGPPADTYEAIPQSALSSGTYPIRLTVNGAESQPFWIEVA